MHTRQRLASGYRGGPSLKTSSIEGNKKLKMERITSVSYLNGRHWQQYRHWTRVCNSDAQQTKFVIRMFMVRKISVSIRPSMAVGNYLARRQNVKVGIDRYIYQLQPNGYRCQWCKNYANYVPCQPFHSSAKGMVLLIYINTNMSVMFVFEITNLFAIITKKHTRQSLTATEIPELRIAQKS